MKTVTLEELHGDTSKVVHHASAVPVPTYIVDAGRIIAVLGNPGLFAARHPQQRKRTILPAFKDYMNRPSRSALREDLEAVRGER